MTANAYLTNFIITAGKANFTTGDGETWQMRQPTPEEAADGDSAYRLAYNRVMKDARLSNLAGGHEALEREARIRGAAAEVVYMLPMLLEKNDKPVFNVFSEASLAEFELLPAKVIGEMTSMYYGLIQEAINQAKKK
jgi:hypothetical protein